MESNKCINCGSPGEYRMRDDGKSFCRCDSCWEKRQNVEQDIQNRYPKFPPSDFSEMDAGERWNEDY